VPINSAIETYLHLPVHLGILAQPAKSTPPELPTTKNLRLCNLTSLVAPTPLSDIVNEFVNRGVVTTQHELADLEHLEKLLATLVQRSQRRIEFGTHELRRTRANCLLELSVQRLAEDDSVHEVGVGGVESDGGGRVGDEAGSVCLDELHQLYGFEIVDRDPDKVHEGIDFKLGFVLGVTPPPPR
jgi:hypothetical protein